MRAPGDIYKNMQEALMVTSIKKANKLGVLSVPEKIHAVQRYIYNDGGCGGWGATDWKED